MLKFIKANIKHQKAGFIGILVLIFIIVVTLLSVLTIWNNSSSYILERQKEIGMAEINSWVYDNGKVSPLIKEIKNIEGVKDVKCQDYLNYKIKVSGNSEVSNADIIKHDKNENNFYAFDENVTKTCEIDKIKKGECYVPVAYRTLYNTKINDIVEVENTEKDVLTYKVAGFFEDPSSGSAMMGLKDILVSDEDYINLSNRLKDETGNYRGKIVHIFVEEDYLDSIHSIQKNIATKTSMPNYEIYTYTREAMLEFMMILQKIFAAFLLLFVLVLIIIAMTVIGHSISNSIEQNYVNMGIMKAIGYTTKQIRMIQVGQYLLAVVIGILFAIPCEVVMIDLINSITVNVVGILIPPTIPAVLAMLSLGLILSVLVSFVLIKVRRISQITPLMAIRGGKEDVYFSSRAKIGIYKSGLNIFLAIRQLISGKKQYINAGIVTTLLVFFMLLVGRIDNWIGADGAGLFNNFQATTFDFGVMVVNDEHKKNIDVDKIKVDVRDAIEKHTKIVDTYKERMFSGNLDGVYYSMNVRSKPELYNVLEGKTCEYPNEIIITEIVEKQIGKTIGDKVKVTYGEKVEEFTISGVYQCANDMGSNFALSTEGFERLETKGNYFDGYVLKDSSKKDTIIKALRDEFKDTIYIDDNTWSGITQVVGAIKVMQIFMYVIATIFVFVVVILSGSKILFREKRDLGIYKSLGFTSGKLRMMFALRFTIVSLVGAGFGIILSVAVSDKISGALLRTCGICNYITRLNILNVAIPMIFVISVFSIFTFLLARKIRKVDPSILITE